MKISLFSVIQSSLKAIAELVLGIANQVGELEDQWSDLMSKHQEELNEAVEDTRAEFEADIVNLHRVIEDKVAIIDDEMSENRRFRAMIKDKDELIDEQHAEIDKLKATEPKKYPYSLKDHSILLNQVAYSISVESGKKIEAIKLIRALTGEGLLEVKNFVEAAKPTYFKYETFLDDMDFDWLLSLNLDGASNGVNTLKFIKMITNWNDSKIIKFMEERLGRFPRKIENLQTVKYNFVLSHDDDKWNTETVPKDDDLNDDYNDEGDIF